MASPEPVEDYEWGRVVRDRSVAKTLAAQARDDFLARLEQGGLTVTERALRRWWPLAPKKES